ncbi:MAG: response regulator transcription factor [Enterocloster asparagiformis]|nr:response regulator transcription factor [Enterocloster asparagiformis]
MNNNSTDCGISIAVCDDDKCFADLFAGMVVMALERLERSCSVEIFTKAEDCCAAAKERRFDLVFLDIEMDGMNGFSAARKIRFFGTGGHQEEGPFLIFVSSHENLVFDAYEFEPLWFLPKDRISSELDRALKKFLEKTARRDLAYRFRDGISYKAVKVRDIFYLECSGHNLEINTRTERFSIYGSLKQMEQELGPLGFFRIHRNYLVNVEAVFSVNRDTVTLADYSVLPLSKDRKRQIKELLLSGG